MTAFTVTDVTPPPVLYARKGERVVCANGHPVCEVKRDIALDEPADFSTDLWRWKGRPMAQRTSGCLRCGGLWAAGQGGGGTLHFREGWRYVEAVPEPHIVHTPEIVRT